LILKSFYLVDDLCFRERKSFFLSYIPLGCGSVANVVKGGDEVANVVGLAVVKTGLAKKLDEGYSKPLRRKKSNIKASFLIF
jgi:hypothetical protein